MSARAMGSGTISFGLVSIPVKLYSATSQSSAISFNMLHAKCGSRLKQQYICTNDGEIVARDQTVKGYEFSKDKYVTFSDEELKTLEEKASQAIEIAEFVPAETIDPVYYDKAYYLGPDKGGERAYQLLTVAMRQTGRTALARYAARGKGYLVQLRPVEGGLVMQQLLYADEVKPVAEVPIEKAEVKEQELKLAMQIVEQIATDSFRPEQYEDQVKKRIQENIQRKVEGQEIAAPAEAAPTQVIDLMEALKASLAAKGAANSAPVAAAAAAEEAPARKPAKRAPRAAKEEGKVSKK